MMGSNHGKWTARAETTRAAGRAAYTNLCRKAFKCWWCHAVSAVDDDNVAIVCSSTSWLGGDSISNELKVGGEQVISMLHWSSVLSVSSSWLPSSYCLIIANISGILLASVLSFISLHQCYQPPSKSSTLFTSFLTHNIEWRIAM